MKHDVAGALDSADFLKQMFARMAKSNPRFSLRAFAKKLGISPGGLSQILSRQKKLSLPRAYEFAQKLSLNRKDSDFFLSLVQIDGAKHASLKADLTERLIAEHPEREVSHSLSVEQFRLISDWYGLAVYEILRAHEGMGSAQKLAVYLGLPHVEVSQTLDRLEKLGMIEKTPAGYCTVQENVNVASDIPNEALRNHYESVLGRAHDSVRSQSPEVKVIGTEVMAFDPEQLEEVRELTDKFLSSLERLAAKGKKRTEVYQAFFNFFKLNQNSLKRSST